MQGSNFTEERQPPTEYDEAGDDLAANSDSLVINIDWRKLVIGAFIIWHLFAITVWMLPEQGPRQYLEGVVAPYLLKTGCWQQWTMFSPSPSRADIYVEAQIVYGDGVKRSWNFPRMHDMGMVERYQQERYRKMIENAQGQDAKRFWPYLARYAVIRNPRTDAHAYPVTVHLVRHYRYLAPPQWHTPAFQAQEFYQETFIDPPLGSSSSSEL